MLSPVKSLHFSFTALLMKNIQGGKKAGNNPKQDFLRNVQFGIAQCVGFWFIVIFMEAR